LRPAAIEAELVSSELQLGKIMLYQDHLERAFERKFKLLVAYRMMRASEGLEPDKAIDVEAKSAEGV